MPALDQKSKSKLASKLKSIKRKKPDEPLWQGPEDDGPQGGITQSMLNAFLGCRERFRVKYILGLQPPDQFSRVLEFGQLWHCAEEALAKEPLGTRTTDRWQGDLQIYAQGLCEKYPFAQDEVNKWYNVVLTQFPLYVDWWRNHPDVERRIPLLQEEVFHVPYQLPSGRIVYLRGKFDSVDLIGKKKDAGIWLKENKTKGEIDITRIARQLKFDLQTCFYLTSLRESQFRYQPETGGALGSYPIKGVIYNVVRRPLSGGRGSISQGQGSDGSVCAGCDGKGERTLYAGTKRETFENPCSRCEGRGRTGAKPPESDTEYYGRLRGIIEGAVGLDWGMSDGEHFFFQRWKVEINQQDVERFKRQFLDPILEQLCDWYEYQERGGFLDPFATERLVGGERWNNQHFMLPFGLYNPLIENGFTDVDEFLMEQDSTGLSRRTELFTELQ